MNALEHSEDAEALKDKRRSALNAYLRIRHASDQTGPVFVPLTRGLFAQVDFIDAGFVLWRSWQAAPWTNGGGCYASDHNGLGMHRAIMSAGEGIVCDHIDGDGLNNVRSNLRLGTQALNCINRKVSPGKYLRGTYPRNSGWAAYIYLDGRQKHLGCFRTEIEAHKAYLSAASLAHGDWVPSELINRCFRKASL